MAKEIYKFLLHFISRSLETIDRKNEWDYFLYWLNEHFGQDENILVAKGESSYKLFFEMPFKIGDKPKIKKWVSDDKDLPAFILVAKGEEKRLVLTLTEDWHCVGDGFFFILYENKNRFKDRFLPSRFGFSDEEKKEIVRIARLVLKKFLDEGERAAEKDFVDLPIRFFTTCDLDVAFWTDGHLRGSQPAEGRSLIEGIIEATVNAAQDSRFKPLTYQNLRNTRIEITLMSDLRLPLPKSFMRKNEILVDKGYRLTLGDKTGLFLPEVFNVRRFRNLSEFLGDLASEKAGLFREAWQDPKAAIEIFEVEDFIENNAHSGIDHFYGPIITPKTGANTDILKERMILAAGWLVSIQESDGNFPPIISPLTGRQTQIDWPRSAFCGWALAEFAGFEKKKKYLEASEKHFHYLNAYFKRGLTLPINNLLLTYAYAGQQALALYKNSRQSNFYLAAKSYAQEILNNSHKLNFESIAFQQISSFLISLAIFERDFLEEGRRFAQMAANNFEYNLKNKKPMNLASQAELVNVYFKIFKLTNNLEELKFAKRVADWLLSYQLVQGPGGMFCPFAAANDSDFVYTRGTDKILEILPIAQEAAKELSLTWEQYQEGFKKALAWILAMQYNEKNTFFVSKEISPKILGGFRHDYFNQEAWIDGAAHFILGTIRFLAFQEEKRI